MTSKHKIIVTFFEVVGWVRIALSPVLIALLLAVLVYSGFQNTAGLIVALMLVATGVLLGIRLANRAWKKNGTISFLSRVIATPELDKKEEILSTHKQ